MAGLLTHCVCVGDGVVHQYLDLDEDHNGLLCRKELLNYCKQAKQQLLPLLSRSHCHSHCSCWTAILTDAPATAGTWGFVCGTAGSTSAVRLTPAFVTRLFEESITYKLPENTTGESEMVRVTEVTTQTGSMAGRH